MIALTSLILAPNGHFAELGKFLCREDWPFDRALDGEFRSCPIKGATLYNADELKREPRLQVTVARRELQPIYGLGSTRMRLCGDDTGVRWKRLDELAVGERVLLPEVNGYFVIPTWGNVTKIQSTAELHPIWGNTPTVAGTLVLDGGDSAGRSFVTVSGIFLSKDDARA